jgi:hypothetical protein
MSAPAGLAELLVEVVQPSRADIVEAAGLRKAFAEEHGRAPTEEEFEELKRSMSRMESGRTSPAITTWC